MRDVAFVLGTSCISPMFPGLRFLPSRFPPTLETVEAICRGIVVCRTRQYGLR
jgi:hypothetical protein